MTPRPRANESPIPPPLPPKKWEKVEKGTVEGGKLKERDKKKEIERGVSRRGGGKNMDINTNTHP